MSPAMLTTPGTQDHERIGNVDTNNSSTQQKNCSKCKQYKNIDNFHQDNSRRDGYCHKCKECVRQYYVEHNEGLKARSAAWKKANPGKYKAYLKAWNQENKGRCFAYSKRYRENNLDKRRQYESDYKVQNRERYTIHQRNYRALKAKADGSHTQKEIEQMYEDQEGRCAYCSIALEGKYHVDHMVPISRGGTNGWENLAITCAFCNLRKNSLTIGEFLGDVS